MFITIQDMNLWIRRIRTGDVGSLTPGGHLVLTEDLGGQALVEGALVVQPAFEPVG